MDKKDVWPDGSGGRPVGVVVLDGVPEGGPKSVEVGVHAGGSVGVPVSGAVGPSVAVVSTSDLAC